MCLFHNLFVSLFLFYASLFHYFIVLFFHYIYSLSSSPFLFEDWYGYLDQLKSFCHRHTYDSLVVVKYTDQPQPPMVLVYSDNSDILNQVKEFSLVSYKAYRTCLPIRVRQECHAKISNLIANVNSL